MLQSTPPRPTSWIIRSLPLKDAETALAAGAQASIPADPAAIARQLPTGKSGDSQVTIAITQLDPGKQQVRVTFHESLRTFVYEYSVEGTRIIPLASEYRDLQRSKVVHYSPAGK